jgi:hypothetical protein
MEIKFSLLFYPQKIISPKSSASERKDEHN